MARWYLTAPVYLKTDPPTIWEQVETDQASGKQGRKQYHVPRYMHPEDQSMWNDRQNGRVIVTDKLSREHPNDIVFLGPPGPDMKPLDDEAQKISDGYISRGEWRHPIDELPGQGGSYADKVMETIAKEMALLSSNVAKSPESGVSKVLEDTIKRQEKMIADLTAIVGKALKVA